MSGETNLSVLIQSMAPVLLEQSFVFASIPYTQPELIGQLFSTSKLSSNKLPMATFCENEAYSVILEAQQANELGLAADSLFACITLNVHSSLDAVGLTAAIATCLTKHNISANVVAAYYHDHVFVAQKDAKRALEVLQTLSAKPNAQ